MMEPTSTTGAASAAPVAAPSASAAPASSSSLSSSFMGNAPSFQVPKVLQDKADELTNRISSTDITRINGYLRVVDLLGSVVLIVTCIFRLFMVHSYADFLVVIDIILFAIGLVFIENHEQFPSIAEKVKFNFGFMFTAPGKAAYILSIALLAFSQGWIGCIVGAVFVLLALFNFFLIKRHPAYQQAMTNNQNVAPVVVQEPMPELRYNDAQQPTKPVQPPHVVV